jgi:hypothetical protein
LFQRRRRRLVGVPFRLIRSPRHLMKLLDSWHFRTVNREPRPVVPAVRSIEPKRNIGNDLTRLRLNPFPCIPDLASNIINPRRAATPSGGFR